MTTQTLNRETFTVSREMEFFSERELTAQIGLSREYWHRMLLKEMLDNSSDACENAGIAPLLIFIGLIGAVGGFVWYWFTHGGKEYWDKISGHRPW